MLKSLKKYYKEIAKELSDYVYRYKVEELKNLLRTEANYRKKQISDRLFFFIHKGELWLEAKPLSQQIPVLEYFPSRPKGFKELRYVKKGWSEICVSLEALEYKGLIQLVLEDAVAKLLRKRRIKIAEFSLYVVDSEIDDDDYISFAICCRVFRKKWW